MKRCLALLAVMLLMAGCGSNQAGNSGQAPPTSAATTPKQGGNLIVATSLDAPSLDPHTDGAHARTLRTVLMYETLTMMDAQLKVQPQLAESWDISPDGLTYTFHLRKGVKFHNGKEMDAEDVKYSYDRVRDPKTASPGRGDFGDVKAIDAVDKYTVRFVLGKLNGAFLANLGGRYSAVIPKDFAKTGNELKAQAMGTGPYKLKEWAPKEKLVYERFTDYWDASKVYLNTITVQVIPDENSVIAALRAGQVDFAILNDTTKYLDVKDDKGLNVQRHTAIKWVIMDLAADMKPTDNVKVRQAISLTVDRQAVIQAATQGLGVPTSILPPALKEFAVPVDQLPNQKRDVARAKQLMAEAGYAGGTDMTLRIINGYPEMPLAASVIATNLKEIGINVKVESLDIGVWIADWSAGKTPPTLNVGAGWLDPDLLLFRYFHKRPGGGDFTRWNNDQAATLLETARESSDLAQRKQSYTEFQKLLAEQAPTVPLYSGDDVTVMQKSVQGYVHHPSGWLQGLRSTWINK